MHSNCAITIRYVFYLTIYKTANKAEVCHIIERERTKPSDVEWLKNVANSGTLGDKIAALALQIQV